MPLLDSKRVMLLLAAAASIICADASSIIVVADWGGLWYEPFYTPGEMATAQMMGKVAGEKGTSHIIAIGDNFYSDGVESVNDKRFNETFESVFTSPHLQVPWHLVAGNHDHYGNVQAQVQYSSKSKRWNFPSLYYNFNVTVDGGAVVEFVMIDTVVLAGNSQLMVPTSSKKDSRHVDLRGSDLPGPSDQLAADQQLAWIAQTLAASTADYLIVAGHYPVYSVCNDGPTPYLISHLKPLLEKYSVTAYLSGHDHCEVHIRDPKDAVGIDYHVMGAAHLCDDTTCCHNEIPPDSLKFHWAAGKGGFGHLSLDASSLIVSHISDKGDVLYTAPPHAPRRKA